MRVARSTTFSTCKRCGSRYQPPRSGRSQTGRVSHERPPQRRSDSTKLYITAGPPYCAHRPNCHYRERARGSDRHRAGPNTAYVDALTPHCCASISRALRKPVSPSFIRRPHSRPVGISNSSRRSWGSGSSGTESSIQRITRAFVGPHPTHSSRSLCADLV
jgi:hypothetical protein